jgi:EmrB/QacA subfamily drug resistance transporter
LLSGRGPVGGPAGATGASRGAGTGPPSVLAIQSSATIARTDCKIPAKQVTAEATSPRAREKDRCKYLTSRLNDRTVTGFPGSSRYGRRLKGPSPKAADLVYSSSQGRWVIAATVLGSGMASIDATVVGIALPTIGRNFHATVTELQCVTNAYTLTLGGLLLLGGALGDRYGRRRLFRIGTVWFALGSLLCGLAPSSPALIAARALQGIGAAMLTPGSLAILEASFVPGDRSKAIGAWAGLSGVATAVGPFLGGWLISALSWRLIFLINLPVALVVLLVSARRVPESKDETATGPLDVPGAVLFSVGLAGVAYGLTETSGHSWSSPTAMAALFSGIGLLIAFCVVELVSPSPLLPLRIFRSRQFSGANAVTFVVYGGLGGALFLLPIQLQEVLGFTPLGAGISLLPITVIMLALSARSAALAARIGPRLQMSVGPLMVGAGLALMARIGTGGSYVPEVLPAVLVLGFGLATTVAPLTAAVLAAAPSENSGIASAVNNDVARVAALIAVALLPSIAGITGHSYMHPAQFSSGFHQAVIIAGGACVAGSLVAVLTIRNPGRERKRQPPCQKWQCGLEAPSLVAHAPKS